jgi:hypothetical protein
MYLKAIWVKRGVIGLVSLAALFAAVWMLMARGGSQQALGHVPPEDRLSYDMVAELEGGGSSYKTCYFDAKVALSDGRVAQVTEVAAVETDRVKVGSSVQDLQSGLERGQTVPLPVYFSQDGKLHAGYDYCKEIAT